MIPSIGPRGTNLGTINPPTEVMSRILYELEKEMRNSQIVVPLMRWSIEGKEGGGGFVSFNSFGGGFNAKIEVSAQQVADDVWYDHVKDMLRSYLLLTKTAAYKGDRSLT